MFIIDNNVVFCFELLGSHFEMISKQIGEERAFKPKSEYFGTYFSP